MMVGEMAGNQEKGRAIGTIVEAGIDITLAGQGIRKAQNALEVGDSIVSGGVATKSLIDGRGIKGVRNLF